MLLIISFHASTKSCNTLKRMKTPILYGNGSSENHGCEAIVRATLKLFRNAGISNEIELLQDTRFEQKYGITDIIDVVGPSDSHPNKDFKFLVYYLRNLLLKEYGYLDNLPWENTFKNFSSKNVAFSIGGDCLSYGYNHTIIRLHDMFRQRGMKTILWSCSINPELLEDKRILKDLLNFDIITARESITYNALVSHGHPHVTLFPDIAFGLPASPCESSFKIRENKTIGINLSLFVQSCSEDNNIVVNNYLTLINYILEHTDYEIALIPHVVWSRDDDRKALQTFYDKFKDSKRIIQIEDHNCMELKDIISRCRFMICTRTHASIAAYSSCVPTLVLGYSVKARGIARDLFGTEENYVVPVQDLKSETDMLERFKWLMNNEDKIRKHLQDIMPGYVAKLSIAEDVIKSICND